MWEKNAIKIPSDWKGNIFLPVQNASTENSQNIELLGNIAPKNSSSMTTDELKNIVEYEQVESIIRTPDDLHEKKTASMFGNNGPCTADGTIAARKKTYNWGTSGRSGHWWRNEVCPNEKGEMIIMIPRRNALQLQSTKLHFIKICAAMLYSAKFKHYGFLQHGKH